MQNVALSALDPKIVHNAIGAVVELYARIIEEHERRLIFMQQQITGLTVQAEAYKKVIDEREREIRELKSASPA